jgi:purine-nucleoside phosphorylase
VRRRRPPEGSAGGPGRDGGYSAAAMATPHIAASPGDFAETVLLPGDPLRARWIAQAHLEDARLVTDVRNMLGYTGTYRGRPVSVMGTGMGVPSVSIYATELARHFGVRRLVRVGSCGSLQDDLGLGEVVAAIGACTDSAVNRQRFRGFDFAAVADFGLLAATVATASRLGLPLRVGTVFTSDLFYAPDPTVNDAAARLGVLAVEMEAAGLYGVAAETGARALCVCTVSDHLPTGRAMTPEERERSLGGMVDLVLEALL